VKLLLAAARCTKGDVEHNLATHVAFVERAVVDGADVVVFPEMSLTGSVDPLSHPERLAAIDGPEVARLLRATRGSDAALLFGIAEAVGDRAYITQCAARDGQLVAAHRKRHLGDDEAGFATGTQATTFDQAGARVGIVVCAESAVDFPVDDVVEAGARLVAFCAAPGLYERRTDDAAFAAGLAWWESAGLADMRRHAQRHRVWVAVATQSGATEDEDFPGLAALVGPTGEVVARTPDWREAALLVDAPL
jgi:predicted amidohydrolase